jgi:hypothetical protein
MAEQGAPGSGTHQTRDGSYLDWLGWLDDTTVGNVGGGLGLVTLLCLLRSKDRLQQERRRRRGAREPVNR